MRTLSIKCYDEQLVGTWEEASERIRNIDSQMYQVIAIRHDRDYDHNDIWEASVEKPHYHIIMRITGRNAISISAWLHMVGVEYRKELDDALWDNRGVEGTRNFASAAMYLTHETDQAIRDGKTRYEMTELVSNLTLEEIKKVREGYIRVANASRKVDMQEMSELDHMAYKAGYDLQDYNDWYKALPFEIRRNAAMKTVEKSFYLGVQDRAKERQDLNRLCVFIQGAPNTGKTYAAGEALKGMKVLRVGGGGTGKFDNLSPSTEAILIDDDTAPNLLNMTDNYMCQTYRRSSGNPYWCGKYYIVTSNLTFREWLDNSGIHVCTYSVVSGEKETEHYKAMQSRFYICHIENQDGKNRLICDSPSTRGSYEAQMERKENFKAFREKFNATMAEYQPKSIRVDYSDLND